MKTSNKILAAFILIVFTVPLIMLTGFRSSIRKQAFTVEYLDNNSTKFSQKGVNKPYKFVKITGPEMPGYPGTWVSAGNEYIFTCKIIPADSVSYSYFSNQPVAKDVLILEQLGDTLLVKYSTTNAQPIDGESAKYHFTPIQVDLFLPVLNNVIVENADVIIDSINENNQSDISFDLRSLAHLELGKWGHSQSIYSVEKISDTNKNPTVDSSGFVERSGKFISLSIKTNDATFSLGPYAWIKDLQLHVNGQSQVNIDNQSRIVQMSGFISDSSKVNANWKNIRRLAALNEK